ncbi:hypothetical protein [Xanthobacter flavus]|uniref:hypothetical protein n=1 Tax=Xanthobacter flavus TaxID=281 RepID=UPI0037272B1E
MDDLPAVSTEVLDEAEEIAPHLAKLTAKRRALLHEMVWNGRKLTDAASAIGMTDSGAYAALRSNEFRSAMGIEMQVLKSAQRPRNVLRLAELRDQDVAKGAAVQAARILEELATEQGPERRTDVKPGIVVVIQQGAVGGPQMGHLASIEHKPLIEHAPVPAAGWGTPDPEPEE